MYFLLERFHARPRLGIGVLALRGAERAVAMWTPTADYLSRQLPDLRVRVVPLDFKEVELAVREGRVDAGTVRTETLERMAAEGTMNLADIFVLNDHRQDGFPLRHSTELYPEWPLAKVQGVPESLALRVAVALMQMPADDPAARAVEENHTILVGHGEVEPELAAVGVAAVASLPLRKDAYSEPFGALCVLTARLDGFDAEEVAMLEQLAGDIGFAIQAYRQRAETGRLQEEKIGNYEETILSLVDMIEKRDTYTAGHTRRVARYCERIARHMEVAEIDIERLKGAAILHDIGKIVIPDAVLLKPGSLTTLEYDLIKQHVQVGYETLIHVKMYRELAEIMYHHHERMDGSGYPAGIAGESIPFLSRILAVADAFDAMTTNRIYKPRMSVERALEELHRLAGREFDPAVVGAAVAALADVTPPAPADPMPKTQLERQRFAYFFNDHLTGLYNAEYLRFLVRNGEEGRYTHGVMVLLGAFSSYNARFGWQAGNLLLSRLASQLVAFCPGALVFRIMGDDFLLLADAYLPLEGQVLQTLLPEGCGVAVEIRRLDLAGAGREALQALI